RRLGLGEQSVESVRLTPVLSSDPAREAFFTLTLEPDDEKVARSIDGRRHDLESRHLGDVPDSSLTVAILAGRLDAWAGHDAWYRKHSSGYRRLQGVEIGAAVALCVDVAAQFP